MVNLYCVKNFNNNIENESQMIFGKMNSHFGEVKVLTAIG